MKKLPSTSVSTFVRRLPGGGWVLAVILGHALKREHAARESLLERDRVVIPTVDAERQRGTRC